MEMPISPLGLVDAHGHCLWFPRPFLLPFVKEHTRAIVKEHVQAIVLDFTVIFIYFYLKKN